MSAGRRQKLLEIAKRLPELVKPQTITTTEGRTVIKGPAVKALQVVAWKREFQEHGIEWPIPPKPAKQYTHGWKGRDKGHKRDRIAAANQAAWKEACKTADEQIESHRQEMRERRHSLLTWYDKLFLSPEQLRRKWKAARAAQVVSKR